MLSEVRWHKAEEFGVSQSPFYVSLRSRTNLRDHWRVTSTDGGLFQKKTAARNSESMSMERFTSSRLGDYRRRPNRYISFPNKAAYALPLGVTDLA